MKNIRKGQTIFFLIAIIAVFGTAAVLSLVKLIELQKAHAFYAKAVRDEILLQAHGSE